ncbi:hypothetical protein ABIE52_006789 [Rhodococcus sp. OAS809]|uniref:hypothetical protein n=1 Tax=Rhodococcus sp. OAS809 TaxID=2663874 RepID=UPI001789394C
MAVTELTTQNPMHREMNKGLMVAFINADLLERAALDVRTSIVLYDADGDFLYAVPELPDEKLMASLEARAGVTFWSKGI